MNLVNRVIRALTGTEIHASDAASIAAQNILLGKVLASTGSRKGIVDDLKEIEFKVFSQWGDDGIIQYLIDHVAVSQEVFIEFGVENYVESNTRFLLMNNNWRGLVIDGSKDHVKYIRQDDIYWRYDLSADQHFITRENINDIFRKNEFTGPIGILSIDIDGNDYWVWEKIDVVDADIVIVEYNSVFGAIHAVTVPYDAAFIRSKAHPSNLFWGCSLKALCLLASKKGYVFVGCNSNGNNAYFVKTEKLGTLKEMTLEEGYVESKFRESRNANGDLTYVAGEERFNLIRDCVVQNIETDKEIRLGDL